VLYQAVKANNAGIAVWRYCQNFVVSIDCFRFERQDFFMH